MPIDEPMYDMMITMIYSFRRYIKNIYVYFKRGEVHRKNGVKLWRSGKEWGAFRF